MIMKTLNSAVQNACLVEAAHIFEYFVIVICVFARLNTSFVASKASDVGKYMDGTKWSKAAAADRPLDQCRMRARPGFQPRYGIPMAMEATEESARLLLPQGQAGQILEGSFSTVSHTLHSCQRSAQPAMQGVIFRDIIVSKIQICDCRKMTITFSKMFMIF